MNALEQYFARTGGNMKRLAGRIGCAASTLSRPLAGKRDPSVSLARKVEEVTDGAVTAQDFIAICLGAAKAKPAQALEERVTG